MQNYILKKIWANFSLNILTKYILIKKKNVLKLCLKCTYFVFQGQHYQQKHGAAMGGDHQFPPLYATCT